MKLNNTLLIFYKNFLDLYGKLFSISITAFLCINDM